MKSWKSVLTATLGLVVALGLAGCSDDDDDNPAGPGPGMAAVRVAHLSPDAGNVDVWVDGTVVLPNVPYRAVSEYLDVTAGSRNIQVTPAGASTPVVIDADVTLADGASYTVFARGLLSDMSVDATVLTDDRDQSGEAKVRFVHASADAPPVDITLTDGTVLFPNVAFPNALSGAVPAGAYDLQVRVAGTDNVVLSFGDVAVSGNTNYSVWAVGLLADESLDAIVTVDAPGTGDAVVDLEPATAEVRVAHLSPDAPNVDVWVDGAVVPALVNVPFEAVSDYLELPAKSTNVQVYATGTSTNPVIDATVILNPNADYTIAATGLVANIAPTVLVDDRVPAGATETKVRFVHASPDAPPVDVVVAGGGTTLFDDVSFGQAQGYLTVPEGTYDLEVRLSSNNALALDLPNQVLPGGANVTVFAIGLAGDMTLAALPAVDTP
jgi:hypothetical protein